MSRADRTIDPPRSSPSNATGWGSSTSVALKRLASCTAKNRFYRANRDLGPVFKTEFLLGCLSDPQLRSRIQKDLLKVEQLHALAATCITATKIGSTPASCTRK